MRASCAISPTSAGTTGCMRNTTMAIIVDMTVDASTPSFVTVVDTAMTSKNKKGSPECADNNSKPCHMHGINAQHSYKECHVNLRNQKTSSKACTNNNNKCRHDSHYQDNCYTSSNDESCGSNNTPMPAKGKASVSSASKEDENYHLDYDGKITKKKKEG
jgi:hypothetical protein